MFKNKLTQYLILIIVISAIVGYFVWQNKNKLELINNTNTNQTGIARFFEFKVLDKNLSTELKDKYRGDFLNYQNILTNDNKNTDALKELAKIKKYIGDYEGARQIYLYAEEVSSTNYTLPASLGDLCQNFLKDYSCAELAYKRAIEKCVGKSETDCSLLYFNLADLYYAWPDKKAETEKVILDGLVKLPDNLNLLGYLANYYKKEGDSVKAKGIYNNILQLDPANEAAKRELENLSN